MTNDRISTKNSINVTVLCKKKNINRLSFCQKKRFRIKFFVFNEKRLTCSVSNSPKGKLDTTLNLTFFSKKKKSENAMLQDRFEKRLLSNVRHSIIYLTIKYLTIKYLIADNFREKSHGRLHRMQNRNTNDSKGSIFLGRRGQRSLLQYDTHRHKLTYDFLCEKRRRAERKAKRITGFSDWARIAENRQSLRI